MDALKRINAIALSLTVIVFGIVTPYISRIDEVPFLPHTLIKSLVTFLSTVGSFGIVNKTLPAVADGFRPAKKFFIGPSYVEGTWVGFYISKENKVRYLVELVEQDFFTVNLRGFAYDDTGQILEKWNGPLAYVNPLTGTMQYMYTSGPESPSDSDHFGTAQYQFVRTNLSTPPHAFDATIIDSVRARSIHSTLKKFSDSPGDLSKGFAAAKKFYEGITSG